MKQIIYTKEDIREARVAQRFWGSKEMVNLYDQILESSLYFYDDKLFRRKTDNDIFEAIYMGIGKVLSENDNKEILKRYFTENKYDIDLTYLSLIFNLNKSLERLINK